MPAIDAERLTAAELEEARRYSMQIAWDDEDGIYVVSVDEIPGLNTHGRTRDEAVAMGEEAIATWLAGLRSVGRPVPTPPATARRFVVERPPKLGADDVKRIRARTGASQTVFAAVLNVSPETLRAWEQGKNTPSGAAVRMLQLVARNPARIGQFVTPRAGTTRPGVKASANRKGRNAARSRQRSAAAPAERAEPAIARHPAG